MTLTAYNHVPIPSFMYGTAWKEEATTELVQLAVASGFRAIDTANQLIHYQEALVGEALQALEEEGIKRDALFLQTKFTSVDGQDHRTPYDASADLTTQVRQSFDSSLAHLGTEYVDSYVLHGPHQRRGLGSRPVNSRSFVNRRILNPWWCRTGVLPRSDGTKKLGRFARPTALSIKAFRC